MSGAVEFGEGEFVLTFDGDKSCNTCSLGFEFDGETCISVFRMQGVSEAGIVPASVLLSVHSSCLSETHWVTNE